MRGYGRAAPPRAPVSQALMILMSSTAASTRLAVDGVRGLDQQLHALPGVAERLTVAVCHAAARLLAAPGLGEDRGGGRAETTRTRK